MTSMLMILLAGLSWEGASLPKSPAVQPAKQKAVSPDDLLKQHRERMLIEEQKMRQWVDDSLRQAKRDFSNDPDGALDSLRNMLYRVKDHPDLGNTTRDQLVTQLQTALRETAARTRAIKLKAAEAEVERLRMEIMVVATIDKATNLHKNNPKKALQLLRSAVPEVWDNRKISDTQRDGLMSQLIQARGSLNGKD